MTHHTSIRPAWRQTDHINYIYWPEYSFVILNGMKWINKYKRIIGSNTVSLRINYLFKLENWWQTVRMLYNKMLLRLLCPIHLRLVAKWFLGSRRRFIVYRCHKNGKMAALNADCWVVRLDSSRCVCTFLVIKQHSFQHEMD